LANIGIEEVVIAGVVILAFIKGGARKFWSANPENVLVYLGVVWCFDEFVEIV
jgi:hypothetical protein